MDYLMTKNHCQRIVARRGIRLIIIFENENEAAKAEKNILDKHHKRGWEWAAYNVKQDIPKRMTNHRKIPARTVKILGRRVPLVE